jgi:hypothetical protein
MWELELAAKEAEIEFQARARRARRGLAADAVVSRRRTR